MQNIIGVIYEIKCLANNKVYIGQTSNFKSRIYNHKYNLKHNTHSNKQLQEDYNQFGLMNFTFSILQDNVLKENLLIEETRWINKLGGIESNNLYNEQDITHMTDMARNNISKNRKGLLTGKENGMYGVHRYGQANPMYGKNHKEETKYLIGKKSKVGNKYIKYTPELTTQIRTDRQSGLSLKQLNEKYNIAISTLSILINHGTNKFNK